MRNWWRQRPTWQKVTIGAVLAFILIGVFADTPEDPETPEAAGTTTPTAAQSSTTVVPTTTTEASTTSIAATQTTTSSTTTTTTIPTTTTLPAPIVAEGSGDSVIDFSVPGDQPSVLELIHRGSSNFAVNSFTSTGEPLDLLVNTIGAYEGRVPINFFEGEDVAELEIAADGAWTATATSVFLAPGFSDTHSGTGDDVVLFQGTGSRLAVTHSGQSNFAIWAYGQNTDLLVNEIGNYAGTVRLPSGTVILAVSADGAWTFDVE